MILLIIIFNVLFWATLACLVKPDLLAKYTGSEPLPRWIILVLLIVIVGLKQAIFKLPPSQQQQAQTENCVAGQFGKMDCSSQELAKPYTPPTAPAVQVSTTEPAATY
ncbi:hypothetical protein [Alkanindiges illinoisensis]|uniref:Uncharacterized protein n=1 Tax=Alkanindiges illinoisensis TaxID=197183 RepID=A0A4Y7X8E2_9GAMM|nr:hypothetical protein [Alkanindiges illinoisensis]TEU23074.1 hypothetical protein E2B99_14355 [Alkanindiges illinoisensis]